MKIWEWIKAKGWRWNLFVVLLALFLIWLTHLVGLDSFSEWPG